jgi:hypothetical protein
MSSLSNSQKEFGEAKIKKAAERWDVTPLQAAKILADLTYINKEWKWVNMDMFLHEFISSEA